MYGIKYTHLIFKIPRMYTQVKLGNTNHIIRQLPESESECELCGYKKRGYILCRFKACCRQ